MERYCFVQDDDGHDYKIPVELREEFDKLLYDEDNSGLECWERPEWQKFEDMRFDGGVSSMSFIDPKKL